MIYRSTENFDLKDRNQFQIAVVIYRLCVCHTQQFAVWIRVKRANTPCNAFMIFNIFVFRLNTFQLSGVRPEYAVVKKGQNL
jgi:hypothetical protein